MRTPKVKANVIRGRAARRGAALLLGLALVWTALGSDMPRVVRTAGEDGSRDAVPKTAGVAAQPLQSGTATGKIAFSSSRDGNDEIYVMNADGTNQTRLTNNTNLDVEPAFNSDGSRIVFWSSRDRNNEIYVMNADGTGQTNLTNNAFNDLDPAFSPDGSKIVFSSNRAGGPEIYIMNSDGTGLTRLTNNSADDFEPSFSPDGSRIVFMSRRDRNDEIYVMNADGTGQTNLTNNPAEDNNPAFSPDGSKIAFVSVSSDQRDVWLMNADGTGQTPLTTNPAFDEEPAFSPDGSKIAFESRRDGNFEIYAMNADGTNQTRITNNPAHDADPSWAPGSVVSLAVNDVSLAEGNSGTTELTFTVTKTGETTENVTVRVDTVNGIAIAPGDYAPIVNQTLTFLPAELTKTVTVRVNGDTSIESDETFLVTLNNATNAFIGDGIGLGTIINDDCIRNQPNLQQVVIFEQTNQRSAIPFAPNASQIIARLPDPLTDSNRDFTFDDEEYYDAFYSNADGTSNPDGNFLTIEGVWRDLGLTARQFGGMNINEVELRFAGMSDRADFVSSFVFGSICMPSPDTPEQCIPGSETRAVDNNLDTFPRFGHTSPMNLNERFRLTVGFNGISRPPQSNVQFGSATYNAAEGSNRATVNVTRTGDASGTAQVNIVTNDTPSGSQGNQAATNGAASERRDYTAALGTLRFAPGETMKTFDILITDDRFDDNDESFHLTLSDPAGAALGSQSTATVQITDNDASDGPSPVKENSLNVEFFVRQHYADFLNRVPDQAGLNFWMNQATGCGNPDPRVCRINVSAAFFLSIENQETGYLAHRAYKAAYGNLPDKPVPLTLREYLAGSRRIGEGVEVGIGNWQQQLEANKVAFFNEFVATSRFTALYQQGINNSVFVDALNHNAGFALSPSERQTLINGLAGGTMTHAQVLRAVAEDADFAQAERNRAFVLAQYFGYLRRNPDDIGFNGQPDPNFDGYHFWLQKLNQFNGNFIHAEMVRAFIESFEYGDRFGQ